MTKNKMLRGAQISRDAIVKHIQRLLKRYDVCSCNADEDKWQVLYELNEWIHEMPERYNKRPGGLGREKKTKRCTGKKAK